MPVCAYFKHNSKTTGHLQLYYAHKTTPLLQRMLLFMLKAGKHLQPTSYSPVHTSLSIILCASMQDNKTQGTYDYTTHQTTALPPRMYLLEVQSELQLTSHHPEHLSTYHSVFVSIVYTTCRLIFLWVWARKILYCSNLYMLSIKRSERRGKKFIFNFFGCTDGKNAELRGYI